MWSLYRRADRTLLPRFLQFAPLRRPRSALREPGAEHELPRSNLPDPRAFGRADHDDPVSLRNQHDVQRAPRTWRRVRGTLVHRAQHVSHLQLPDRDARARHHRLCRGQPQRGLGATRTRSLGGYPNCGCRPLASPARQSPCATTQAAPYSVSPLRSALPRSRIPNDVAAGAHRVRDGAGLVSRGTLRGFTGRACPWVRRATR
jgi:hypothetical protein